MTQEEFYYQCIDVIEHWLNGNRKLSDLREVTDKLYNEVTKPHWISVEDELPPMHCHLQDLGESTYGRCKIFCDSLPVVTHRVDGCIDMHCLMFNGEKNEFVWGGWNGSLREPFDGSMITHWMPLPKMPILSNSGKIGKDLKGGEE